MTTSTPLVIAVSINGERSKADNPNIPRTHDEVVRTALACYDAGASIIHAHNTDVRQSGRAAAEDYLAAWRQVRAARPGALWYPTLTDKGTQELDHVLLIDDEVGLEFACVDPGSVPLGRLGKDGLPEGQLYANSFEQIESAFAQLEERRLGAQMAIYEPHYMRTVLAYHAAGRLPKGSVVNFYFGGPWGLQGPRGFPFGLPPTETALNAYLEMLGDVDLPWTVSVWGGDILETDLPRLAIERGGHVQIGLESHFHPDRKPSNEEQIERVVELAGSLGRPVAGREETLAAWRAPRGAAVSA